jgi:MraZ protein
VGVCGTKWDKVERRSLPGVLPLSDRLEQMFLSQFTHNLDDKGRLTIPSDYRDALQADGGFVMQGFDQNLMVLPSPVFDAVSRRVNALSMTDPNARFLRRLLFSSAAKLEMDRAGRILIPQFLRQQAGLINEVKIIGNGNYFELWSPDSWSTQAAKMQDPQQYLDDLGLTSV